MKRLVFILLAVLLISCKEKETDLKTIITHGTLETVYLLDSTMPGEEDIPEIPYKVKAKVDYGKENKLDFLRIERGLSTAEIEIFKANIGMVNEPCPIYAMKVRKGKEVGIAYLDWGLTVGIAKPGKLYNRFLGCPDIEEIFVRLGLIFKDEDYDFHVPKTTPLILRDRLYE